MGFPSAATLAGLPDGPGPAYNAPGVAAGAAGKSGNQLERQTKPPVSCSIKPAKCQLGLLRPCAIALML
jgi:hypothetical protein